jgi:hypothetical protein
LTEQINERDFIAINKLRGVEVRGLAVEDMLSEFAHVSWDFDIDDVFEIT